PRYLPPFPTRRSSDLGQGVLHPAPPQALTFSGIGVYSPLLFKGLSGDEPAPLGPLLRDALHGGSVIGARHAGRWMDIGTPERLQDRKSTRLNSSHVKT